MTVVVAVVDGENPQMSDMMHTTTTLLGVSSGAATAEQLARAAVSAVSDGREITGILVATRTPADRRPAAFRSWDDGETQMPTRMTG